MRNENKVRETLYNRKGFLMNNKIIFPGAEIISLALYLKKEKTLVLGDLHIGQEENLNKQGIMMPRTNFAKLKEEIMKIFSKTGEINKIILLGDVKHEFSIASNQEWREVVEFIEILEKKCKKIIIIKGNHDNFLKSIAAWKKIELVDSILIGKVLFCHGDKIILTKETEKAKYIIIGHEHAAVTLKDEHKSEKFKCFAKTFFGKGKKKKQIIVTPSLNFLTIGTDLVKEKPISPYLQGMKDFECWIVEEGQSFYFGKIKTPHHA